MFNFRKTLASAAAAIVLATGAQAATSVDVELSLLIDVSGSVSTSEFDLQRQGYVDAFMNSDVVNAILSTSNGRLGKIAAEVVYWSTSGVQNSVVGWTLLDSASSISSFASSIALAARTSSGNTGIGSAIQYGANSINGNDFDGIVSIIDVSGDGTNNSGISASDGRDFALAAGIDRINGIAIEGSAGSTALKDYYTANVIGGTGSFALSASSFDSFGSAIKTKLQAEITGTPPAVPVPAAGFLLLGGLGGFGVLRRLRRKPA